MDWRGRRESTNVEDRRGQGGGGGKTPGLIGIIVLLVGAYYGVDLSGLVGTPDSGSAIVQQSGKLTEQEEQDLAKMSKVVLGDTETVWGNYFSQKLGKTYKPAKMVFYRGGTPTSCGTGQSSMGPFYCPGDQSVYLDLSFYDDMRKKLGASGEAAFAYVIAHEVGHHVQNLLGILPQVNRVRQSTGQTQANALSVKLELQADCFAGVWGYYAARDKMLDADDFRQAMAAAEAVGDDRLQKNAQGYAVPDSFTHGSSADRMAWLNRGLQSGDINRCDTFSSN